MAVSKDKSETHHRSEHAGPQQKDKSTSSQRQTAKQSLSSTPPHDHNGKASDSGKANGKINSTAPPLTECQKKMTKKEQYKVLRFLGDGSYATVYEALHVVTGQHCALKIFDKATLRKGQDKAIVNEIQIMSKLRHPNIVGLIDAFETKTKVYVAMEYASGGELWEKLCNIGYYCEADAAHLLYQLLSSIKHLHDHGIVHRDIKPENLLFSDKSPTARLMLADFGLAEIICPEVGSSLLDTVCGTAGYMAPEVLLGTGYLGQQADIWSIGMVAYFLLSGTSPFDENQLDEAEGSQHPALELLQQYKSAMDCVDPEDTVCASECVITFTPEETWKQISKDAKDFVSSLLYYRPNARPSAGQALKHHFITKYLHSVNKRDPPKGAKGCSHEITDATKHTLEAENGGAQSTKSNDPHRHQAHEPPRRMSITNQIRADGTQLESVIEDQHQVPLIGQALTEEGVLGKPGEKKSYKSKIGTLEEKKDTSASVDESGQESQTIHHGVKRTLPASFQNNGASASSPSKDARATRSSSASPGRSTPSPPTVSADDTAEKDGLPNIAEHLRAFIMKSNDLRKSGCQAKAKERWEQLRNRHSNGPGLSFEEVRDSFERRHGMSDDEEDST